MIFLLDANFPKAVKGVLEGRGDTVLDFRSAGRRGDPDGRVMEMAAERDAVILTTDRDFFHTLGRTAAGHPGIVVIALKQPTRAVILQRLEWLLGHLSEEQLRGRTVQLRDRAWQMYPPLP